MPGLPLFLQLQGMRCLVFGGGEVAVRKVKALLRRGAKVMCVSRDFSKEMKRLAKNVGADLRVCPLIPGRTHRSAPTLRLKRVGKHFRPVSFLNGARLVIAATSDRAFNARVACECRKRKIWVNAVDDPEFCDFYFPAIVERGPLQVAISTDGTSPFFARRLREELEKVIPRSTGRFLERLGKIRRVRRLIQKTK